LNLGFQDGTLGGRRTAGMAGRGQVDTTRMEAVVKKIPEEKESLLLLETGGGTTHVK